MSSAASAILGCAMTNPDFLLGGRTSASAECRHWSGRAVRWSSCAILLRSRLTSRVLHIPGHFCIKVVALILLGFLWGPAGCRQQRRTP